MTRVLGKQLPMFDDAQMERNALLSSQLLQIQELQTLSRLLTPMQAPV